MKFIFNTNQRAALLASLVFAVIIIFSAIIGDSINTPWSVEQSQVDQR